jgi:hypothetical protein
VSLGDRLGQKTGVRRLEERPRCPEKRLDHDHLGHGGAAGEDQHCQDRVERGPREVGRDHDPLARDAVGPHAAEEDQGDQRQGLGGQHHAEIRCRAGPLSDVESQRNDHDLIADGARRLAKEQVSKISVAQNAQVLRHHAPSSETATAVAAREAAGAGTQMRGMASIAGPR